MLDGDGANVAILVEIEQRVFVQAARFGDFGGAELDKEGIGRIFMTRRLVRVSQREGYVRR